MHLILEEGLLTPHGVTEKFTIVDSSIEFTSVKGLTFYKVGNDSIWTMTAGDLKLRSISGALLKDFPEFDSPYIINYANEGEGTRASRLNNIVNNMVGSHPIVPIPTSHPNYGSDAFLNMQDGLVYDIFSNKDYDLITQRNLEGDEQGLANVIDLPTYHPFKIIHGGFDGYMAEIRDDKLEIIYLEPHGVHRRYIGVIGIMKDNKFLRMDNPIQFLNYPNPSEITRLVCDSYKDFKRWE